jgi:tetratricopeptide (TPR) repeat protein
MKLAFCLVAALCLPVDGFAQASTPGAPPEPAPAASAIDAPLFYQLLLGELSVQGGDPGAGYSLLLDAARKTNDADLFQRAVDIALQSRAGDAALQAARAWSQAQPSSQAARQVTLQILLALNQIRETGDLLKVQLAALPVQERSAAISAIPRAFIRVSDKKEAARIVEQALAEHLNRPETGAAAWIAVGRMRVLAGDPKGALDAAQRAVAFDPHAEGATLLALEVMGPEQPLAETMVRQSLEKGAKPEIRMAYARALLETQRLSEAIGQLEIVTTEKPDYAPAWLSLGLLQLQVGQSASADLSLQRYLALVPSAQDEAGLRGRTEAFLALAQIAERRKDFVSAGNWLDRVENPEDRITTTARRASILARQGKLDQARALIRDWPQRTPADARVKLMAEVQLLRDNGQADAAYALLGAAIARQPDDFDLLYDQALIAEKLGNYEAMERLLRQLIAAKPDYHHAYNALGYSLAERNVRLNEARQLVNKALEFAPDDPMIRDSLGWVEYRSGNLAEALRILESAFKARPDADIAAHLGEVLWKSGQREQALSVWKQGLLLGSDSDTLTETLKRLQVKP